MAYVVGGTRFRALRARGAREARFFFMGKFFFADIDNLFWWSKPLNSRFEVAYVVDGTRFRTLRARGAREAGFFSTDRFLLPRRFQRGIARPWGGSGSVF